MHRIILLCVYVCTCVHAVSMAAQRSGSFVYSDRSASQASKKESESDLSKESQDDGTSEATLSSGARRGIEGRVVTGTKGLKKVSGVL